MARPEDQALIKKTLDQISVSADAAMKLTLEFYQVDGIGATQLQSLLQPRLVESTITVDAAQDRLIVWGPEAEHLAFAEVITKLKADPLAGTKPVLEFYPLTDETMSTSVTSVLTTMVPTAKVTWDAETRRLMVVATPKDQQIVKQTIEQMTKDAPPAERQILQIYPIDGMRVIEDPQTGELAIWAKATQHEKLAELFNSLGATSETTEPPVLIAYPMQQGSAKTAFDMLKQLYPTLKLTLDEKGDRVLVNATLSQHSRIKQALGQVDVEPAPGSKEELRSYATGNVNPTSLVAALQKLLPDMQITPDLPAQKLIAFGTVADHEVLEKALGAVPDRRCGAAADRGRLSRRRTHAWMG